MVIRALITSALVGTTLTALNQWPAIFGPDRFVTTQAVLTYLVPFCVSYVTAIVVGHTFQEELQTVERRGWGASQGLRDTRGVLETIHGNADQVNKASKLRAAKLDELMQTAERLQSSLSRANATAAKNGDRLRKASDTMRQVVQRSKKLAADASGTSADARDLGEAIDRLSAQSQQVEMIAAEITKISSKTRILSINASIEAGRTGETGKAFGVVAEQVGQLSESTATAAATISETLEQLRDGLGQARDCLTAMSQSMDKTLGESQETFQTVQTVDREVGTSLETAATVSQTIAGQISLFDQIAEVLQQIRSDTEAAIGGSARNRSLAASAIESLDRFHLVQGPVAVPVRAASPPRVETQQSPPPAPTARLTRQVRTA